MNCAIVALVRGYENLENYNDLINRNNSIFKAINSKLDSKFPMILFHEGNINLKHQEYINEKSLDKIRFINIEKEFQYDKKILAHAVDLDRFSIGYRLMCRFNFFGIWNYLKDFEYIFRIDEDIIVNKFDISNLDKIQSENKIFSTISKSKESHTPTNETLPILLKNVFNTKNTGFYNHKFPYTNFYISKTDFWLESNVKENLKKLVSDQQLIYRWGDLPIIGSFLNYYRKEIFILKNSSYFHESHDLLVSSNRYFNFR